MVMKSLSAASKTSRVRLRKLDPRNIIIISLIRTLLSHETLSLSLWAPSHQTVAPWDQLDSLDTECLNTSGWNGPFKRKSRGEGKLCHFLPAAFVWKMFSQQLHFRWFPCMHPPPDSHAEKEKLSSSTVRRRGTLDCHKTTHKKQLSLPSQRTSGWSLRWETGRSKGWWKGREGRARPPVVFFSPPSIALTTALVRNQPNSC